MNTFSQDLKVGTYGECMVWNHLTHKPTVKQVVDVRDDKYFQRVDVDFLVERNDRQFFWVEVKTDRQAHETGNIVYEITTSGNIGCFEKTQATIVYYYLEATKEMYAINVSKLRDYIETSKDNLRIVPMGNNATGYLLKIAELEKQRIMVKEEDNE